MRKQRPATFLFLLSLLSIPLFYPPYCLSSGVATIDRLKIEEKLLPGQTKEGRVRVSNSQKETMRLKIYVQDWSYTTADGSKNFGPAGLFPYSCSPWISIYPDQVTLPPKGSAEIRYTISAPPDARGGYHSVIFFENLLGQTEKENGKTVNISARLASLVYVEIAGTVKKQGKIRSLALNREEESKRLEMKLDFENTGNSHLIVEPNFDLMNAQGAMVARGVFPKMYTMPGSSASAAATWLGNLTPGVYDLILTIELGDDQVLVKEWKITISAAGGIQENLS